MKSFLKYFLVAIIFATLIPFSSCKKGANDPFLSLRSRNSRFEGTWKLSAQTYTVTSVSGNTHTTNVYSFDGLRVKRTRTTQFGSATPLVDTSSYSYSETIEVVKDNTIKETIVQSNLTTVIEGNWAFLGADKDAGLKKKEAVIMYQTKYTFGTSVSTSGKTDNPNTLVLDELSNAKMVVILDQSNYQDATHNSTTKGTVTYVQ